MSFQMPDYADPKYGSLFGSYDAGANAFTSPNLVGSRMSMPDISGFMPTSQGVGGLPGVGQLSGADSWLSRSGLGANLPTFGLALGGLQTIGGLWGALQAAKVAKQQLNLTKRVTNANLANQTQSYNTEIQDRARSRGFTEGQNQGQISDYITRNSLPNRQV